MTGPLRRAARYHGHAHGTPADTVSLSYEARFLRRKVLTLDSGARLLVDLVQTTSLDHDGVLIDDAGAEVRIIAAPEALLEITGPDLHRIAWHVGNRHTPCQIDATRLLIQRDHVMVRMLEQLGAAVRDVTEPFTPEGGAYGHGRTHGHDHSHRHGPEGAENGHAHSHDHDHDHDHDH